jgi:3-deoxy-D-manno-octulosonic-acid transferase
MISLYSLVMSLALAFVYPVGWLFALFGKTHYRERLVPPRNIPGEGSPRIWIHAASVGEAVIAFSMAVEIRKKKPGAGIFVTTTTRTGLERIRFLEKSSDDRIVDCSFLAPFDHPFIARRFIKKINPSVYILIETEIWPSLISAIQRCGIPVCIINGKLGYQSFHRYNLFRLALRPLMSGITLVCVQSRTFARRFHWLGVPRERIEVLGNIKFDSLPNSSQFDYAEIRKSFGLPEKAEIFTAGSTRPGEEEILVRSFQIILDKHPDAILILAPRHLNRIPEVEKILHLAELQFVRRSSEEKIVEGKDTVFLLDTMGELIQAFACAEAAFVGGSLRDFGGHNPMEPASLGIPILFGPYMEQTGSKELLQGGAAILVHDETELAEALDTLLSDKEKRARMAEAGPQVIRKFRGILARTFQAMEKRGLI